jgi:hypothetical protein
LLEPENKEIRLPEDIVSPSSGLRKDVAGIFVSCRDVLLVLLFGVAYNPVSGDVRNSPGNGDVRKSPGNGDVRNSPAIGDIRDDNLPFGVGDDLVLLT